MFSIGKEKVGVFIDAANLSYAVTNLGWRDLNWDKFKTWVVGKGTYPVCLRYYTAIDTQPNGEQPLRKMLDYISDHGYETVTRPAKAYTNAEGVRRVKGNLDIVMTCDILQICDQVDRIILVTGDGDFTTLVERIQLKGRRVTIISSRVCNPPMLSGDLRRAANEVIELADHRDAICGKEE